jgi:NADH-quinone oxidoreductase subunit E
MSEFVLSNHVLFIIESAIKKYPPGKKRSALKTALMSAQEEYGYISVPIMDAIAVLLEISPIDVYEVASFYTLYDLAPVGTYKISLCTNISCWLRGSDLLLECIKTKCKIKPNQTTSDGLFTLKEVECLAACGQAPALQINGRYHGPVTVEQLDRWLSDPKESLT